MYTPNDDAVKQSNSRQLVIAREEDQRHRLHTESVSKREWASPYFNRWVTAYLEPTIANAGTRAQVLRDMVFPLVTNELVDRISDAAAAVHNAQDRYIGIQMATESLQVDAEEYIERRDIHGFMTRKVHNALFMQPNSCVIIDTAADQLTEFPEPYVYLLGSDKIEKVDALDGSNEQGLLRFLYFNLKKGPNNVQRRAMFDDTHISIYERAEGAEWTLTRSVPHNLPFCPAFKVWSDTDDLNPFVSNTLLRPSLGLLDRYMFWDAAQHSNDLKAAFSPFWSFEERRVSCGYDYKTKWGLYACNQGLITVPVFSDNGTPLDQPAQVLDCPACAKRNAGKKSGPGSNIKIPVPSSKDAFDMRLPAGWIEAPILALEYITKKVMALGAKIQESATGNQQGPQNEQALNESQILAILEAARQIGDYLAEYFELTHKRILDAILGLRYGPSYLGCTVNYGRRFSVLSGDLLMTLLDSAKTCGAVWLIEEINNMIKDYYGRGDVSRRTRFDVIDEVSRYPFMSPAEMITGQIHTLDREGYLIQVALYYYIKRFEREKGYTIEQLVLTSTDGVQQIIDQFKLYVAEIKPVVEDNGKNTGGSQNPGSGGNKGN